VSEDVLEVFTRLGGQLTDQRRWILEAVPRDAPFHPDELCLRVRLARPQVGRATVFRTLRLLQDMGLVERCAEADGARAYRLCLASAKGHHHHLLCVDCGRDTLVAGERLRELEEALARTQAAYGHAPVAHELELRGRCAACRRRDGEGGAAGTDPRTPAAGAPER